MPEIKHNFAGGKMSKDVDERLVPNGEYRHAMNIQVSTSEGSDVGAVENILGNKNVLIDYLESGQTGGNMYFPTNSTCVASVSDEKNDAFYWLITEDEFDSAFEGDSPDIYTIEGSNYQGQSTWPSYLADIGGEQQKIFKSNYSQKFIIDGIYEYKKESVKPVFIDDAGVTVVVQSGNTGQNPTSQLDLINTLYSENMTPSSGFLTQGLGYNFQGLPLFEVYDSNRIKVGQKLEMWGFNPWTGKPQNFLEGYKEEEGGVKVLDIIPQYTYQVALLAGLYGVLSEDHSQSQLLLTEDIYQLVWNQDDQKIGTNYTAGPYQIPLHFIVTHINFISGILNFSPNRTITGINIIDDMLFWTDNFSEPKKINIPRSIKGTNPNGYTHTKLINEDTNLVTNIVPIEEEHITVIRKSPKTVLTVETQTDPVFPYGETVSYSFLNPTTATLYSVGDPFELNIWQDASIDDGGHSIGEGNTILLNNQEDNAGNTVPPDFPDSYQVALTIEEVVSIQTVTISGQDLKVYELKTIIEAISLTTQTDPVNYNWALKVDFDQKFKNKFPRFSYRYKYIDGEYSTFAPFTNIIFEPGQFKYDVKEAFNLGMENIISKITLKHYDTKLPKDVVEIDLLYKESDSPIVYLIDTVSYEENWDGNIGFEVKPNMIKAALPENQLLRPWDNVPRKALAQDVTGSRLIYGNYLQNYNDSNFKIKGNLIKRTCDLKDVNDYGKSLKSIRNYSLGISYLDKYGRQTPVFTNKSANIEVPINKSGIKNQILAQPFVDAPKWATHYKVFVKENSNEYYNLAMDRVYDAKDGNIWLSFPSSDRNKVDEETFLILKKNSSSATPIQEDNRYKILSISNEVPNYVKHVSNLVAVSSENSIANTPPTHLFNVTINSPVKNAQRIDVVRNQWDATEIPIHDIDLPAFVRFEVTLSSNVVQLTQEYKIMTADVTPSNPATAYNSQYYSIKLHKPIEEDWLETSPGSTVMVNSLKMRVYRRVEQDSAVFDGRFFVKIKRDTLTNNTILSQAVLNQQSQLTASVDIPFYYLADGFSTAPAATTGAASSDSSAEWESNLSPTGANLESFWFIDSAYYSGYYSGAELQGGMWQTHLAQNGNSYLNSMPNAKNDGYNEGIYEENGKYYIDLSFGGLLPANPLAGEVSLHQDGSDINWINDTTDFLTTNNNYSAYANWQVAHEEIESHTDDGIKHWKVGSSLNQNHVDQLLVIQKLVQGSKFRFFGDDETVYQIVSDPIVTYYTNWKNPGQLTSLGGSANSVDQLGADLYNAYVFNYSLANKKDALEDFSQQAHYLGHQNNRRVTYKIEIDKDPTQQLYNPLDHVTATVSGGIQFVDIGWKQVDDQVIPVDPAIWETEPKKDVELDIYYEVDGTFPLTINESTNIEFAPIGTTVTHEDPAIQFPVDTVIVNWDDNVLEVNNEVSDVGFGPNDFHGSLIFHRKDGSCVTATLRGLAEPFASQGAANTSYFLIVDRDVSKKPVNLSWFNCYSWGNGVESNRIRDDFNQVTIDKGAKASSTIDEPYKEEHRKYGLIYSGLYNSTSGVNNLNQFIQAEKITKDVNPSYGSIQKLHSRDTDLIALCEDKILKILANKDAVFNADGNAQLTANENVLGQTVPFVGEYGISTNPESFASESYRVYFTDKVRDSVMRLSMDGLTPISLHGMKDYFRDNLKLNEKLIGSYDDKKDEYNLTLPETNTTVSFKEDVRGWVSFKSFVPENAISCANEYYTFKNGHVWRHHEKTVDRNTFYNVRTPSTINVLLNQVPGSVKSFTTLNYEGSQSEIKEFTIDPTTGLTDNQYYNLEPKKGWFVDKIFTDLETGSIDEFIEKEGKWFNYIKGESVLTPNGSDIVINSDGSSTFDQASFSIQGLGILNTPPVGVPVLGCTDCGEYWESQNGVMCPDGPATAGYTGATNFDPNANTDDGSCTYLLYGCLEPSATNYYPSATADDGSCVWAGCVCDPLVYPGGCTNTTIFPSEAYTYNNGNGILDDGTCNQAITGCTDSTAFNFCSTCNASCCTICDGSDDNNCCITTVYGCTLQSADNYNSGANVDDGSCIWAGCTDPLAPNYANCSGCSGGSFPAEAQSYNAVGSAGIINNGTCNGPGCIDPTACNYDSNAGYDDGSCLYCANIVIDVVTTTTDTTGPGQNNGQISVVEGSSADNTPYTYSVTNSTGSSNFGFFTANNITTFLNLPPDTYSLTVTSDCGCTSVITGLIIVDGFIPNYGCTDVTACNTCTNGCDTDDGSCQWTTCAGCMDSIADNYSFQTNTTIDCLFANTQNSAGCTIACGDGVDDTDQGISCCEYTVTGCWDPTATNQTTIPSYCNTGTCTYVDDGTCMFDVYGCMDNGSMGQGWWDSTNYPSSTGISTYPGVQATNYDLNATVDDGSCLYTIIDGCTDPIACNYQQYATHDCSTNPGTNDQSCCVYGFYDVNIGDPNTTDVGGSTVPVPVHFEDGISHTNATHYMNQSIPSNSYGSGSVYPFGDLNETDVGLGFKSMQDGINSGTNALSQYNTGDIIQVQLHKYDSNTQTWNMESIPGQSGGVYTITNPSPITYQNGVFGDRLNAYPHPFGPDLHGSGNYSFNIYDPNNMHLKQQYKLVIRQRINNVWYDDGDVGDSGNACGVSKQFEFFTLSMCDHPGAVTGCTDPLACGTYPQDPWGYNPSANCDDGSCQYGTTTYYFCDTINNAGCVGLPQCQDCNDAPSGLDCFVSWTACNNSGCGVI